MKKYRIILSIGFIYFSCISQTESGLNIKGNWFYFSSSKEESNYYSEIYITNNEIYFYNELAGAIPQFTYKVKKDSLFIIANNGNEKENNGLISKVDDNTIHLKSDHRLTILKRVKEGVKLEDYILYNNENYISDFNERLLEWYKSKE